MRSAPRRVDRGLVRLASRDELHSRRGEPVHRFARVFERVGLILGGAGSTTYWPDFTSARFRVGWRFRLAGLLCLQVWRAWLPRFLALRSAPSLGEKQLHLRRAGAAPEQGSITKSDAATVPHVSWARVVPQRRRAPCSENRPRCRFLSPDAAFTALSRAMQLRSNADTIGQTIGFRQRRCCHRRAFFAYSQCSSLLLSFAAYSTGKNRTAPQAASCLSARRQFHFARRITYGPRVSLRKFPGGVARLRPGS